MDRTPEAETRSFLTSPDEANGSRWSVSPVSILIMASCVGILIAILIPILLRQRELARLNTCESRLQQIGMRLYIFAENDPSERFCTGASDFELDGCPDSWGWVADIVNTEPPEPEALFCPSNLAAGGRTLNSLLNMNATDILERETGVPGHRLESGFCGADAFEGITAEAHKSGFWGTDIVDEDDLRANVVARAFLANGYTSNYVPSWFLVRSVPLFNIVGVDIIYSDTPLNEGDRPGLGSTRGPLSQRMIDSSPVFSGAIPLMSDGAAIHTLTHSVDSGDADPWGPADHEHQSLMRGERLVESHTLGPVFVAPDSMDLKVMQPSRSLNFETQGQTIETTIDSADGRKMCWQDTRQWSTYHHDGDQRVGSILFADGSVRRFVDRDQDGYLNPGFGHEGEAVDVFASNIVELPMREAYSGVLLIECRKLGVFED